MAGSHVITRSVRDSALMLDLIGGPEAGDPYACPTPVVPFLQAMNEAPKAQRIALWRQSPLGIPVHADCLAAVDDAAKKLADLGHHVEEVEPGIDGPRVFESQLKLVAVNQANDLDFWAQSLGRPLDHNHLERMTLLLSERGRQISGCEFSRALSDIHGLARAFGRIFEAYDLILSPTLAAPPMPLGVCNQDSDNVDAITAATHSHITFTALYNMSGCPAASIPLAKNAGGLPIGIMLGAALGGEARLLQIARQCEEAYPWFTDVPGEPQPHLT